MSLNRVLVSVLVLALALIPVLPARSGTRVYISHTSDIHGFIGPQPDPYPGGPNRRPMGGFAVLKTYLNDVRGRARTEGAYSFYFDIGDVFQGTPVVDHHKGACMTGLMNAVGVDAGGLGNHEFDYGIERMAAVLGTARYPVVCANVFLKGTGKRPEFLVPWVILRAGKLKIGLVGILTPETLQITSPKNVEAIEIPDPVPIANALAYELREQGVDFIILLSHSGLEADSAMADNLMGIDLILGGHSHAPMETPTLVGPSQIPLVHPGAYLTHVNELILDINPGNPASLSFRTIPLYLDSWQEDPTIKAQVASYEAGISGMKRVLGASAVELNRGVIGGDCPEGSWIADAMLEAVQADFSFINFGGIRRPIFQGAITVEDIFLLQPFDNTLEVISMTGSQVIDLVERSLSPPFVPVDQDTRQFARRLFLLNPEGLRREIEGFGYLIPGNLKISFDPERPPMNRIVSITDSQGRNLSMEKIYRVALNSYIANGGDGYKFLRDIESRILTQVQARDAIMQKIERDNGVSKRPETRLTNLKLRVTTWSVADKP